VVEAPNNLDNLDNLDNLLMIDLPPFGSTSRTNIPIGVSYSQSGTNPRGYRSWTCGR